MGDEPSETQALPSPAVAELQRQLHQRMEKLAEAEQRMRAVIDNVIDGIITINERAAIETFNPAAEKIFGYPAPEVIGRNVSMLMPEPYHSEHDRYVSNYLHTGEAKIIGIGREVVGRRKDGSVFPMDLAVSEYRLDDRRMFVGIVRDISERKRAAQIFKFLADASVSLAALVDLESTLQKVARLAVSFFADWCAIDMLEADGELHRVAVAQSQPAKVAAAQTLGRHYLPDLAATHGPSRVLRTGSSELIENVSEAMLAELAEDEMHLEALRALRPRSAMCVPLEARGKVLGVMTFLTAELGRQYEPMDLALAEDLSHRAAVAVENARLYAEVKEADRRKDEFLAMLAHELRNPLAPIRNGLDLLGMAGVDAETAQWVREMMQQQVQHLVRLVDDLLDVSRIMRGKIQLRKEQIDLAEVIARSIEAARPLIDAQGHELLVSLPSRPVRVELDSVRIAQVITNLLNNAAKYQEKPGHIWLDAYRQRDHAVVRVRDDGIGIEPQLLLRVFDLFTQADHSVARSQGGLGIGLTLVRSLVTMHGGSVTARSDGPGRGTEFTVRLPALVSEPPPAETPGAEPSAAQPGAAPRRILVVDDNMAAARACAEMASLWQHEVRVAHTGPAALEIAKAFCPDVILLDIGLPGMSGYEVAERLRQQPDFAHILLVALTGYGQEEDRRRSHEAGFDHHLVKPVAPDVLCELFATAATANSR